MKKNTTERFLIGSWVSFYPFAIDSYETQLDKMKEAGLNFNIFPMVFGGGVMTPEAWERIEREYKKRDMFYFIDGGLKEENMKKAIEYAADKENCIGYHLMDEPRGSQLAKMGEMCRAYREGDGTRYPFVNLFPSYVGKEAMEGDYYQYCSRFVKEAGAENIEYLSHDFYPFLDGATWHTFFSDAEVMRRVALENGKLRTHAFPQSCVWRGTRMPNVDEMRWHVYAYLAYGFKALSWFNLVCPGSGEHDAFVDALVFRDGSIHDQGLYDGFVEINHEVLTIGDTLMKLDAIHAYHSKDTSVGAEILPDDFFIKPTDDSDVVISHMVSKDESEQYIMIFNKSYKSALKASFALSNDSGFGGLVYQSQLDGKEYPVELCDGRFEETFRAGEGKLYKLV